MAEVTDVQIKKKVLIQLGVPFFLLVVFVVGIVIFGTLYFSAQLKGDANPHNVKDVVKDTSGLVEEYVDSIFEVTSSVAINRENEEALRNILSSNKAILVVSFFDENGAQLSELHKSRANNELLNLTFNGTRNLEFLGQEDTFATIRVIESVPYILVGQRSESGFVTLSGTMDPIQQSFDKQTIFAPLQIIIASAGNGQPLFGRTTLPPELEAGRPANSSIEKLLENNSTAYGYVTDDGGRVDGHYQHIDGTSWILIAESEADVKSGFSREIFLSTAIILVIFALLLFYYIHVFNQKVVIPLKKIEKALHYFKTGDYSEPIEVNTENEFVGIAHQLNQMALHIEGNTSERVSELKRALSRQNTDTRLLIEKDVELREQGQKLKELDQAKSMFVSVAAHQMRTPLAAVKWAIKLVMDGDVGPVNAEQKEYLNKGYESTSRMIGLINDLLDVDKIESDKFSYSMKEEKLETILQGIVDDLTPIATEKGVKLLFQKETPDFSGIIADTVKLRNALQNLIDNAIKYTIGGGDVTVRLHEKNESLHLSISDTGIGIPLSEQGKVFGKFFRAKNAVRQETDGSGLGLYIVQKIIEKHGGSIRFESKENVGTTFFIDIPVAGSSVAAAAIAENKKVEQDESQETMQVEETEEKENGSE